MSSLSLLMLFGLMPPLPAAIVHRLPQNAVNLSKKSLLSVLLNEVNSWSRRCIKARWCQVFKALIWSVAGYLNIMQDVWETMAEVVQNSTHQHFDRICHVIASFLR